MLVAPMILGISTVSVALGAIADDLGLSQAEVVWVLVGYLLTNAMAVAVFGRLSDLRGVRFVLITGGGLIALGSILTVLSTGFATLVAGRLLQGAGTGALPLVGFAIAGARFEGDQRATVLGILTGIMSAAGAAGTLIGGALSDAVSWRAVLVLPLIALIPIVLTLPLAPRAGAGGQRIDAVGATIVVMVSSTAVFLIEAPSVKPPSVLLAALVVLFTSALVALVRHVRSHPTGFVPASVVRSRAFVLGTLVAMSTYASYLAVIFAAPELLLRANDWTSTQIGLVLLPAGVVGAVVAGRVGGLTARYGAFRVAAGLGVASTVGTLLAGVAGDWAGWTMLALALVLAGFVGGQAGLTGRVPLTVEPSVRGVAMGLFQLMGLLGGAVGSAAVAGLTEPLGLSTAVACIAIVPAAGAVLALIADADDRQRERALEPPRIHVAA